MTINRAAGRPVLGVSALILNDGRALLVRRARAPFAGLWSLPGGHVEAGEKLAEAAAREVREETGIVVHSLRQVDIAEIIGRDGGAAHHFVLVVFRGTGTGEPAAADDAAEARWVKVDGMAGLPMTDDTRRVVAQHAKAAGEDA